MHNRKYKLSTINSLRIKLKKKTFWFTGSFYYTGWSVGFTASRYIKTP